MSLITQISKEDFNKVIAYSQNIENPKTDMILDKWAIAKQEISQRFLNGKTRYTYPDKLRFKLNEQAQMDRFEHLVDYVWNLLGDYSHPLCKFLRNITVEEFYFNRLSEDYIVEHQDGKKISKGSKIIKSFKYFLEDDMLLHDLQDKASELIQENKVEGYLTFSIHPLDFLSSSENTYNWRSCHALDGEYRAGNLSYMCDRGTMIVYLSTEEKTKLPHFPEDVPWNSKKWRMLLHFDEDLEACFAGRQYPFTSPGALEEIFNIFTNWMVPFAPVWGYGSPKREKWEGWFNDYIDSFLRGNGETINLEEDRYCVMSNGVWDKYEIVLDAPHSKHFNDVTRSSCYTRPYYMYKMYYGRNKPNFVIGAEIPCLYCGEAYINGDDTMMCSECECEYGDSDSEDYCTCNCCGTRFYYDNAYWVGDDAICPDCANKETFICDECEDRYYNSEKHYHNGQYICNYCLANKEEEE